MVLEGGKGVPDYSVKSSEEKSEDKTSESESKSESESFKLDNLNVVQSESWHTCSTLDLRFSYSLGTVWHDFVSKLVLNKIIYVRGALEKVCFIL